MISRKLFDVRSAECQQKNRRPPGTRLREFSRRPDALMLVARVPPLFYSPALVMTAIT